MPRHLTDELHLFSLEDLVRVKKGLLVSSLKDVLKASLEHVACCEVRFAGDRCVPELSFMHQGLFWVLCTLHDLTSQTLREVLTILFPDGKNEVHSC